VIKTMALATADGGRSAIFLLKSVLFLIKMFE
jgi:hypothetical protein